MPKVNLRLDSNAEDKEEIIILNFDSLGDNILFSSVIKSLRKSFPHATITLICKKACIELYTNCSEIDQIRVLRKKLSPFGSTTQDHFRKFFIYIWLLFKFRGKVSKIIGPSWLMCDSQKEILNNFYQRICPRKLSTMSDSEWNIINSSHQVPRMLGIAKIYGAVYTESKIFNWLNPPKVHNKITNKKRELIIALGAGHASREYGLTNLLTLINLLKSQGEFKKVFIVGKSRMISYYNELRTFCGSQTFVFDFVDKLDLKDTLNLIEDSELCVSNDSGIAHLAATVHKPVIVISAHAKDMDPWHLHSPNRYHPWGTTHVVLQPEHGLAGCKDACLAAIPHCINQIEPAKILEMVTTISSRV
jgi:heptosyltransferase-2